MNTPKFCPKCGYELTRWFVPRFRRYHWGHAQPQALVPCDYSEPEITPRCPKRKERAK